MDGKLDSTDHDGPGYPAGRGGQAAAGRGREPEPAGYPPTGVTGAPAYQPDGHYGYPPAGSSRSGYPPTAAGHPPVSESRPDYPGAVSPGFASVPASAAGARPLFAAV